MTDDLAARHQQALAQVTTAETDFLNLAREASGDPALLGQLGQRRAELDAAQAHLVDVEAEVAAAPPPTEPPAPALTLGGAVTALADAKRFRPADIGFGHGTSARVKFGVSLGDDIERRMHRLLADYRHELESLGLDYDAIPAPAAAPSAAAKATPSGPIGRSRVWVDGTAMWIRSPYAAADLIRERVLGAVWSKAKMAWSVPATPQAAIAVAEALGAYGIDADERSTELVRIARQGAGAQIKRTAVDLPPVPGSKTTAWTHQLQAFWFARELPGVLLDMEMGEQPHRTPFLTPDGWVEFGSVEVGDYGVGSDGHPTRIVAIKEFESRELVRMHLSDGAVVECATTHPWTVRTTTGDFITVTAEQVEATLGLERRRRLWCLPSLAPVQHPPADLPVDPFVLGALLAYGVLPDKVAPGWGPAAAWVRKPPAALSSEFTAQFALRLPPEWGMRVDADGALVLEPAAEVYEALDGVGLIGLTTRSTFIPPAYLTASEDQRYDLLDGLLLGTLETDAERQFRTSSIALGNDVSALARSLGGHGRVRVYGAKDRRTLDYRVTLGLPSDNKTRDRARRVVSVERTGIREPMRCIEVEADDHLYVTDGYVLTHNTGKSKVVCDLVHDSRAESTLIVCPERVVGVWPKQFGIHSGGEKHIIDPRRQNKRGEWSLLPIAKRVEMYEHALHECGCGLPHVLMTNYAASAHEPFKSWSLRQHFDYIAYDESHRLRSSGGVWSRWAAKMHSRTERAIGGTGTLQAQTPLDVFGQARAVEPGLFGKSYITFERRYALKGGFEGKQVIGYQREDELAARLSSITYHAGEEVLDLPEMLPDVTVTGNLSPRAYKAYKAIEDEMYAEVARSLEDGEHVADEVTVANVLVRILRCQQVTGGALPLDSGFVEEIDTTKYKLLLDELEDISAMEPVVVFARFHHDLDKIQAAAEKLGRPYGELSGRRSDALASDATLADGVAVAGVQIQSGGTGVDFTRSAFGIYYSVGHSLGDYLQSRKRLQRPGQVRPVRFRHLVLDGTVDVDVYEALANRQKVTDRIAAKVLGYQRGDSPFH